MCVCRYVRTYVQKTHTRGSSDDAEATEFVLFTIAKSQCDPATTEKRSLPYYNCIAQRLQERAFLSSITSVL